MANIKLVADAMFYNKKDWINIPDEEKESCFFLFNRYFSKKYINQSQLLNVKNIDKVSAMNLWYTFMLDEPYPRWFWSKGTPVEKSKITDKDFRLLVEKLNIKDCDVEYLINKHFDFIKQELSYYKSI
jgi:hypothetical protein